MPRTHKPRKRYVPKRVDTDPVETAIALATVLRPHQQAELGRPVVAALTALRMGTGPASGWPAWCNLADGLNVAEQLALAGICSDRLPEFLAGQAALHALHTRHAERNSWTLRAAELQALATAVDLHLVQLEYCTQGEMRAAIFAVQQRASQALAGNASRNTLVCVGVLGHAANNNAADAAAPTGATL